jgi:hypothetical protein
MKKLNFLVGTVSGLFGGLLLSNKKLRNKLKNAEDPKEAAKIIGNEMKRSGKDVAKEAKEWVESDDVQKGFKKAKKYLCKKLGEVGTETKKKTKSAYKKAKKKVSRCRK